MTEVDIKREIIENILAQRYASSAMVAIWSPRQKIIYERELWIAVLKSQTELGLTVPDGVSSTAILVGHEPVAQSTGASNFILPL